MDYYCQMRKPLSPCGIHLIDGSGKVVAHLIYEMDKDKGIPVKFDDSHPGLYEKWKIPKCPLDMEAKFYSCTFSEEKPEEPCHSRECICRGVIVNLIPYRWAQDRHSLVKYSLHWLNEIKARESCMFSPDSLDQVEMPIHKIVDHGEHWKKDWNSDHVSFLGLRRNAEELTWNDWWLSSNGRDVPRFDSFPLEIFEVISKYLDGRDVKNICEVSPLMEARFLEAFEVLPALKRERCYFNFCMRDFTRSTILRILASYDAKVSARPLSSLGAAGKQEIQIWESAFLSYMKYWSILLNGEVHTTTLNKFEKRLKGEMLILKQAQPSSQVNHLGRITRCGGGQILVNLLFPFNFAVLTKVNMVVIENMEEVNCRHVAPICRNDAPPSHFTVEIVHLPVLRSINIRNDIYQAPPNVERVLIGVCDQCITTVPIQGGTTRRMGLVGNDYPWSYIKMDPIIEVHGNIVALWLNPGNLIFYILAPVEDGNGYELTELYKLHFSEMRDIWNKISQYRSSYIPVIREYFGTTSALDDATRAFMASQNEYFCQSSGPTYYGIAFVSHIYGIESFKPFGKNISNKPVTIVESLEPQYYTENGRQYLPGLREVACSGKGHGVFAVCSNTTIALSWDCITWLFDKLSFPTALDDKPHRVTKINPIQDNGLILIVDNNILLMEICLTLNPPVYVKGVNVNEPKLEVKPLRIFRLQLPMWKEITHLELNFDKGRPFLFITVENKPCNVEKNGYVEVLHDEFSFVMKRIDFID